MVDINGLGEIVKTVKEALKPIIKFTCNKTTFNSVLILKNDYNEDFKNVTKHIYSGNLVPGQEQIEVIKPQNKCTIAINGYFQIKGAISWTTNNHFLVLMFIIRAFQTTQFRFLIEPVQNRDSFPLERTKDFNQVWKSAYNPGHIHGSTEYKKYGYNLVVTKSESHHPHIIEILTNLKKE